MADPVNPTQPPYVAGALPALYKDPRPLDFKNFGGRGLKRTADLSFARANSLPLLANEFQVAQMFFPIIFVGDPVMPVCVLGFQEGENLFLSRDGRWDEDSYVPAYVRRYPFVLAEVPDDDRKFLCADFAADVITDKNPDVPFFSADGKPTEAVGQALEFCRTFQESVVMTQALCAELKSHNMLKHTELRANLPDGTQHGAGTFTTIDPAALDHLSEAVILDFRKRGLLPLIYLQQTSLNNWGRLNARRERAQGVKAANNR